MKDKGYDIIFLDETYVSVNHQPWKEWIGKTGEGRKTPIGKGQRIIVIDAGGENTGFIDGCSSVFVSKHLDGRGYHSEMNSGFLKTG